MATDSYENALQLASSLSRAEQLRLIEALSARAAAQSPGAASNLLELCGLGKEIWQGMDAQEYVRQERASWNG